MFRTQEADLSATDFTYTIYIRTTPEDLWAALTDNETERAWWSDTRMVSSFKSGSTITFLRNGTEDVVGEILESEAPYRLTHTFRVGGHGPMHDEGVSHVTYEIKENGPSIMLKVTHVGFPENSAVRRGVSQGWPAILSSLKTMLEGGAPLRYADWGDRIEKSKAADEQG